MKIALVGKGGSGKSSISWLVTHALVREMRSVLAIDADHNMDLTALLGKEIMTETPTLLRKHDEFRAQVKQREDKRWHEIVLDGRNLPSFTLNPKDSYTASVVIPISDKIDLITVGLGAEDILYSDRCAHGHSAPLKYYLPLLIEGDDHDVVIDGVAGIDMLNAGLFLGADALIVVVEPHQNSMRVLLQAAEICKRTRMPFFVVINKSSNNTVLVQEIEKVWKESVIAIIPSDPALLRYDFPSLSPETCSEVEKMLVALRARTKNPVSALERLRDFEREGQRVKSLS